MKLTFVGTPEDLAQTIELLTNGKVTGTNYPWFGGHCPVPSDTMVTVTFENNETNGPIRAGIFRWDHRGDVGDIVSYTVHEKDTPEEDYS